MAENQISAKSYYYWQRKLRKETFAQMNHSPMLPAVQGNSEVLFTELRIPEPKKSVSDIIPETIKPTAVIKTATMTIALSNDISDNLLSRILKEVSNA
jgi:putative transposase